MLKLLRLIRVLGDISPELQTILRETLDHLGEAAQKTPGTKDDEAVALLKTIFRDLGVY